MRSDSRTSGFSIVEVVIATVLMVVGVSALIRGLGGLDKAEAALLEKDMVTRLAHQKLDEILATGEWQNSTGGTFDEPYDKFQWTLENVATGVDNLNGLRLTVTDSTRSDGRRGVAETLQFVPPTTTDAGAGP